ncbi:hypothetical protein GCM10027580_20110 [Corynebacterium faecale]
MAIAWLNALLAMWTISFVGKSMFFFYPPVSPPPLINASGFAPYFP